MVLTSAARSRAFPRERIRRAVARPEAQDASAPRAVLRSRAASAPPASGGWGGRRRRPSEVAREARRLSERGNARLRAAEAETRNLVAPYEWPERVARRRGGRRGRALRRYAKAARRDPRR